MRQLRYFAEFLDSEWTTIGYAISMRYLEVRIFGLFVVYRVRKINSEDSYSSLASGEGTTS